MKRFLCVLLIAIMLIPPMAVSAAGAPAITMTGAEGKVGDTVQIVIAAENLPDCASMELIVQYDTAALKPTAHAKGDLTGLYVTNLNYTIAETDGIGRVGQTAIKVVGATTSTTTPLLSGDPTLVTLTFEIIDAPQTASGALVELQKYSLSQMDANLTKVTGIPLPTAYVTREQAVTCAVTAPNKTAYYTGDALDLEGGSIWVAYADNDQETVLLSDLPEGAITGYDMNTPGEQTVYVTYAGQTGSFTIYVQEVYLETIEVTELPTKTEYVVGQEVNLAGGKLTLHYSNNTTKEIDLTNAMIDPSSPYDNMIPGPQEISICYEGAYTSISVEFIPLALRGIRLDLQPEKNTYFTGDTLNLSGGSLELTYNDGTVDFIATDDPQVEVSGYDPQAPGGQTVRLIYKGFSVEWNITVTQTVAEELTFIAYPQREYLEGQPLDLSAGRLEVRYNNGKTEEILMTHSNVSVEGYHPLQVGEQPLTVRYGDLSAEFTVTVVAKEVETVELLSAPNKKVYIQGEALDLTGGKIRLHYNNGDQKDLSITADLVSGYRPNTAGVQALSVTVEGKQAQFQVTVLSLDQAPTVCISGGEGVVGQTITVTLSTLRAPVSGGFQLEFSYDPSLLQPIAWTDGLAENLVPNDDALGAVPGVLKLAGLYMEPFSGNRTLGTITFRLLAPGNATVTLVGGFLTGETFGSAPVSATTVLGKSDPIRIKARSVERIELTAPNKRIYWMGEGLDFVGSSAVAYFNDGTHQAISPASMTISGFNNRVGGEQTVTLSYGGKSASFTVVVLKNHPFTDVLNNHWYYTNQSVPYVYTVGLMNGMTATTFGAEGQTTRAQLVTILYRLEGAPAVYGDDGFTDVSPADWYYDQVRWAVKNGIVNGMGDGTFAPNASITRGQMATILFRYAKQKGYDSGARDSLNSFADKNTVPSWYKEGMQWAVAEGIISGTYDYATGKTLLDTDGTATRAQIATVLMRYVEKFKV